MPKLDLIDLLRPFISHWPTFAGLFLLLFLFKFLTSGRFKGWIGEWMVRSGLRKLDPARYRHFHDLYLPRPDDTGTTQIDHVAVSAFGIFVIETKNYRGWIFGTEKQALWTQQIYRMKSRFQNPLHQNLLHVRALADFLKLPDSAFLPVVFFVGDSQFKTPLPDKVLTRGLIPWIQGHKEIQMNEVTRHEVIQRLEELERTTDRKAAARTHVAALRERKAG